MNSLLEHGIQTELNGGDIPAVPISALMVNIEKRFFNIEAIGLFWLFFLSVTSLIINDFFCVHKIKTVSLVQRKVRVIIRKERGKG